MSIAPGTPWINILNPAPSAGGVTFPATPNALPANVCNAVT